MDHYKILGLSPDATFEEIKKAYRKLVFVFHPDRNFSPEAATKFKEIQKAFEFLSVESNRTVPKPNTAKPIKPVQPKGDPNLGHHINVEPDGDLLFMPGTKLKDPWFETAARKPASRKVDFGF